MESVAKNLRNESRKAVILIIWTDCDREGEFIGDEIRKICVQTNPRLAVYRARYSSTTFQELSKACMNLKKLDDNTINAVSARVELDLRSGSAFTRMLTLNLCGNFSAFNGHITSYGNYDALICCLLKGSCQFPTLGFIVEQFQKILHFQSEVFYTMQLDIKAAPNAPIDCFAWKRHRLFDRAVSSAILSYCLRQPCAAVSSCYQKPTSKWYHAASNIQAAFTAPNCGASEMPVKDAEYVFQQAYAGIYPPALSRN